MKYILIALLFIQTIALTAQNVTNTSIRGTVLDHNNKPIEMAQVVLKEINRGAQTDKKGDFFITEIPFGTYTIAATFLGYSTQEKTITIKETKIVNIIFTLKENTSNLQEVQVVGKTKAQILEQSVQAVNVIETKEAKFQSADLGEVMAKSAGISVQREGGLGSNTRFALNGLSGDKIRFFYDGIPLDFTPFAFGIANVPVNSIKQVEVYKGVVPIQFGADALGGAVNLVSPTLQNGLKGAISYQYGSFYTNRVTANLTYANSNGWFVSGGGFFDQTDNNYKIDVAIANEKGQLQQQTVERFHDGYKAKGANVKTGIRGKKWANILSIEGYYGDYYKEVQNSQSPGLIDLPELGIDKAVAGNPFGDIVFTNFSKGLNLSYNVNPAEKWEIDLKAGYNYTQNISIDTTKNLYNWHGEIISVKQNAGEFGEADYLITKSKSYFLRSNIGYTINENHKLNLTIAPTSSYRTGDNLLIEVEFDPSLDKGFLNDFVTGLEYNAKLLREKLQFIAFAKNYRQSIRIESLDSSEGLQVNERSVNNYGGGSGLRYAWTPRFATKVSYEYAYRLPRQNEIFGDGQLLGNNLELLPENSHNVNLQWSLENNANAKTEWQMQGNFFMRRINNLIFLVADSEGFGTYQNVWSANSHGVELAGKLTNLIKALSLNFNCTYQNYINTSDTGPFAGFKSDRIPNTPYFFANAGAQYQLHNLTNKNGSLSFFWNTRYVLPYFLGWESSGLSQYKAEVPKQFTQGAGITQKINIKHINTALTFEVQNLTNAKVFDLYGVQRPGSAFYLKITTQF